ncbi:hypothetical protein G7K_4136-t1 [Saitoella complicata NRRL Y-17804]|uniref:Uncharacterized protein n=1 Tax=Saitoella complicata (strain BCRC 22490 / CBS 7301 / JCM 7358 / NBRC 10748 / NRRL Y-17804) TaxID=698492 RepID=A0A0E9NJZ2_SAICN|nr:hypothetical protein G7K_4136-t1 [Saitoella complicata NRRL Y-17804]
MWYWNLESNPQRAASAEGEAAQSSADGKSATSAPATQQPAAKEAEFKGPKPEKTSYQFRKGKRSAEEAERRAAEEGKMRIEREQMEGRITRLGGVVGLGGTWVVVDGVEVTQDLRGVGPGGVKVGSGFSW